MAGVGQSTFGAEPARVYVPTISVHALVRKTVPFLMIVLLLLTWEIIAHSSLVTAFMLPPVEVVAQRLAEDVLTGDAFRNAAATLYRALIGFGIAAVVGVSLGILMVHSRLVSWFFDPIVSVGFPIPKVALLPIFILWFGLYDFSKIMLITTNAVFPIITATVLGLSSVDQYLIWSARSLGASEQRVAWQIVMPAALPQILTGLQIGLPISMIVAVVAEIVMSGDGLGGAMIESARNLDSPAVFAGIVEIAITGFCVIKAIELIRRRLLRWHSEATINAMT